MYLLLMVGLVQDSACIRQAFIRRKKEYACNGRGLEYQNTYSPKVDVIMHHYKPERVSRLLKILGLQTYRWEGSQVMVRKAYWNDKGYQDPNMKSTICQDQI